MSSDTPPTFAASQAGVLRRAWLDVAATAAPQLPGLPGLLDQRLNDLEAAGRLDEPVLLAVAEEASQYALEQGAGEVARALSKRLRRAIYEFLLALDAVNPAELATAPAQAAASAEPRTPVAFSPADVPGADDPVAVLPQPPAVPLWEATAPPPVVREVYRVATRGVEPRDQVAPVVEQLAVEQPVVDEMGAEPRQAAAEAPGEPEAADIIDPEAVAPADEQPVAAEPLTTADADTVAPEPVVAESVADAVAEAEPVAEVDTTPEPALAETVAETAPDAAPHDSAPVTAEDAPEPTAETCEPEPVEPPSADQPTAWEAPVVELPIERALSQPPATPQPTESTPTAESEPHAQPTTEGPPLHVVEPAPAWSAALLAEPPAPPANGAKPPRELLRVPRQFRRLPPLAQRPTNGAHTEPELPPAALPPVAPEPPTAASAPAEPDEDSFGVPSVPWMLPEPPAAEPEPAPTVAAHEEPEEDMGVPFGPFADATDDADLPRPPALAEEPLHPLHADPAAEQQLFVTPLPGSEAPLWTPGPVPTPSYALPRQPDAEPFPIAPREGFHLTDPGALEMSPGAGGNPFAAHPEPPAAAAPPPPAPAPQAPAALPTAPHEDNQDAEDNVWRVRQSPRAQLLAERMAQKRREEAARVAFEAASVHDDDRGRGRRRRQEDALPDLPSARRQLDDQLRKKRGAEAGALLQRLAQEQGGREIADLALDAGDRCRALGQSRSATNCYLAAWRADPLYETPLWRLSDVCLNDQEIDLAVGYLERIAELMRSRGDDEGAIGVYRKIAMIAPERQDVRDVIRLAKTTGRLDG